MGDILELYNLIKEHYSGNIAINIVFIVVTGLAFLRFKHLRHPRYKLRYFVFVLLLLFIVNTIILGWANMLITILLILLLMGYSLNNESLFDKKPIYMLDFVEKYEYLMLKAEHLRALEKCGDAYEVYNSIDERKLFDDEKTNLIRKKAFILYTLGDMNKATHYLDCIYDELEPNYLMLKSMINENAMNLEGAAEYLQRALNLTTNKNDPLLRAMIYHNYGRLRFIEGNYTDAISFYRQSNEIAKNQKHRGMIHTSYQNLIHTYILKDEKEKGVKYFREYEKLITSKNLNDMKEEFNLCVEIARQNGNIKEISKMILRGYKEIHPLLTKRQQMIFDTSVLRMMFNNRINFDIVMNPIYENIDNYFELEMPEKHFTLKEINIPLKEIQFPHCHKFAIVHKKITDYMINDALEEIDSYIIKLNDYEVHQRCSLEREKVGILREWIKPYRFADIYRSMFDIKGIYQKNGMHIEAIFMDLDIADECYAQENYIDNEIEPLAKKKMEEHVKLASDSLRELKKYPRVVEGNIRLAIYYMALNEKEKAKKHFDDFEDAKIPINHFSFWIRDSYERLYSEFRIVG